MPVTATQVVATLATATLMGCASATTPTAPAPPPPTDAALTLLSEARATRLDLARFVSTTPTVTLVDGQPWLGLRGVEGAVTLAAVAPPAGSPCDALPVDGGFWWFPSSPPAALHLRGDAALYWLDERRSCWVLGPLIRIDEAPSGASETWSGQLDPGEAGPPALAPMAVTLEDVVKVSATVDGEAITLTVYAATGDTSLALERIDDDAPLIGDYPSERRGTLGLGRLADGVLDITYADEIDFSDQGAPHLRARARWQVHVDGPAPRTTYAAWDLDHGLAGDGVGASAHRVVRAGALPLAAAKLVVDFDAWQDAPLGHDSPDGTYASSAARQALRAAWQIVGSDGVRLPLWPQRDDAQAVAPAACGPAVTAHTDAGGLWLTSGERAEVIDDLRPTLASAAELTSSDASVSVQGGITVAALGCGALVHQTVSLEGTNPREIARWGDGDEPEIVEVPVPGEGSGEVTLLVDPVTFARIVLERRYEGSWSVDGE